MKFLDKLSLIILLISYLSAFQGFSQSTTIKTANTYVQPFPENFGYGSNMGYFSNGWDDKGIATALNNAGVNTVRASLPESFVEQWGTAIRLKEFQYYSTELGMKGVTVFIGGPSSEHQDKTIYPGSSQPSKLFANLYEPIWKSDGSVNPNNYYAQYVFNLVQTYGEYVKIWEVVNEPDITTGNANNWLTRAPLASEMPNTRAPFYHYIRMLRISYEVIKKYQPESYITPGGLGYPEYLDALLRYTDNPNAGAVTSQYPNKGGAYFDILSYHVYPSYFLSVWKDGGFVYTRNSDNAAAKAIAHKKNFELVLNKYGYNGSTYPKKDLIITETNISRRSTTGNHYGTDEMQRNYGIKALILAQKNNVKQVYLYAAAETIDAPAADQTVSLTNSYELMGLYENLKRDSPGNEKLNQEGIGYKTTAQLLTGYIYDASRTAALNMPASMEGAAFRKDGNYVYVLWAKALNDKSEAANATYSFPDSWNLSSVVRKDWNFSSTGTSKTQSPDGIALNSSPAFFIAGGTSTTTPLSSQTITFAPLVTKILGSAPFTVNATATSGLAVSFKIVSGPATISGNTITLTSTGTVTVEASQSGNYKYSAANPVKQSFAVNPAPTSDPTPAPTPGVTGSITRDFWSNVKGSGVTVVPVNTTPTKTSSVTLFEAPAGQGSLYGQRIRGYVTAPVSGQYTFWIAADDKAELYLSTSEDPAKKTRIAYSTTWTNAREWDKQTTQRSVKITLMAGKRYYIEALHLQSWGSDNLAVGWQLPNGTLQRPISGQYLSPYSGTTTAPAPTPEPTPEPDPEPTPAPTPGVTGSITRDFWSNVKGSGVTVVPVNTTPTKTSSVTLFEAPAGQGSLYGQRIRGYVTAPVSGQYTFWIAADDKAELYLSTSEDPAKKTRIAYSTTWTNAREWDKQTTQRSVKITLMAGKRYYIEALHLQSWGSDNLAVGWQLPNGTLQRPISGQYLSPYQALQNISSTSSLQANEVLAQQAVLIAFPNPFTTSTMVQFTLDTTEKVSLEVFDMQGRLVRSLLEETVPANEEQNIQLMAEGLQHGVYIIRLVTSQEVVTQKIIVE